MKLFDQGLHSFFVPEVSFFSFDALPKGFFGRFANRHIIFNNFVIYTRLSENDDNFKIEMSKYRNVEMSNC